jgi:hypothetical protein
VAAARTRAVAARARGAAARARGAAARARAARAAAARARAAAESGCVESGCAPEEAERGIDRKRHGNSSALGHRNCTGWRSLRNRCTAHMCHYYRVSRCSRCCRRSWGCGSADSGCALTEVRNLRSRCRGCIRPTELRARHRRIQNQRRSCRCLSIVQPWEREGAVKARAGAEMAVEAREVTGMGWLHMRSTQIRPGKYRGRLHIPPCTSARYYSSS